MATATTARTYVDFVPPNSLQEEPDKVALRVDLSAEGFRKEQIRVQIDSFGRLRITGERSLDADGSRWRRFHKEFQVPDTCDPSAIRARLDKDGILLITMTKLSAPALAEEPKAPGADMGGDAAAGQDHEPAGHASAQQAGTPAEEKRGQEEDAGGAAMDRPGQEDEQHPSSDNAAPAPAPRRPAAYGFAKDRRIMLLAIFALMLALVGAGLLARCRLTMDQSAETSPSGSHIVSLSGS
ncbi:inactive protein RESTRICTED TEV MOVEMENT 2-like [Panicum virgatum]|uniref:SHSP domain-containing protein n=1 Tax=Panicum virgatum TaxID=38727 RepID=A0A8T0N5J2_PANVG|nr:inactive protein RESTRICTED TEV MOVEMENT 2-like [Panicum virgatum]KAG2543359.1 hypothetical protein PVAP13_9NG741700 [Panicum virgatum]